MKPIVFRIIFIISLIFLAFTSYAQQTNKEIVAELSKKYPAHFMTVMSTVLMFEGGFSNILDDPGGATNFGVTQEAYDLYRKNKNLPIKSVKYITIKEVYDCYYRYYYKPAGCDTLPEAIAFVHFDTSVNFGVGGSKKLLQRTLKGIKGDLKSLDGIIALKYVNVRVAKRYEIVLANQAKQKFLKGWLNRDDALEQLIINYY